MQKKPLLILLILLGLSAFSACLPHYPSVEEVVEKRSKIKPITFERKRWLDDKGIGVEALWDDRPGLARDLLNRNILIGKSFSEVKELLGDAEIIEYTNSISYDTFIEEGVADPVFIESLVISFDKNEKVENAEIQIRMMDGHPNYRTKSLIRKIQ
jgi:hypothetical protein